MIHVITSTNRHLYEDAIDKFDTVYMLAMEGERIIGGQRLYPTTGPTMIDQVFPALAAVRGVPSDPLIWELSRFFVVPDRREGGTIYELTSAVQEFCLDEGITHVSAVIGIRWLQRLQQVGCVVQPLGLPQVVEGEWTIATLMEISAETLDRIRHIGKITGSVLTRRGLHHSVVDWALSGYRAGIENRV
jgi:acyl-homoserine lactone synthase